MRMTLVISLAFVFAGCSTDYGPSTKSAAGGYEESRIADDVFRVEFHGNAFTSKKKARQCAMRRAAEVAMEHNYSYFSVIGENDDTGRKNVDFGTNYHTTGTVNNFGQFSSNTQANKQTMTAYYPGVIVTIKCFEVAPTDKHSGKVYSAKEVVEKKGDI